MKLPILQTNTTRAITLISIFSLAISARATVPSSDLPDIGSLDNFVELGNLLSNQSGSTVNGSVGLSNTGIMSFMAGATINGDLSVGEGATLFNSGTLNGSLLTDQDLSTEQNLVFSTSAALAALTPDVTISGNQTSALDFDVNPGDAEVVNLDGGLNLNGENITLTGGGSLVLNIQNSFSLVGSASILGDPANIFINYEGTDFAATQLATIDGLVFAPNAPVTLSTTMLNGGVYSGTAGVLAIANRTTINPIPEPGTIALAGMGGFATILLRQRNFYLGRKSQK